MAAGGTPFPHLDPAIVARIFYGVVFGVPAVVVLLQLCWPALVWLRALACGLVLVPATISISALLVALTEPKGGSILNGCAIFLPIIGGVLSIDFGWKATGLLALGFAVFTLSVGDVRCLGHRAAGRREIPPTSQRNA